MYLSSISFSLLLCQLWGCWGGVRLDLEIRCCAPRPGLTCYYIRDPDPINFLQWMWADPDPLSALFFRLRIDIIHILEQQWYVLHKRVYAFRLKPKKPRWTWNVVEYGSRRFCRRYPESFILSRMVQRDVVYLGRPKYRALVYEAKWRGGGSCGVSANEYSCAHEAQINFGDLSLYLTYDLKIRGSCSEKWKFSDPKRLIILVLKA